MAKLTAVVYCPRMLTLFIVLTGCTDDTDTPSTTDHDSGETGCTLPRQTTRDSLDTSCDPWEAPDGLTLDHPLELGAGVHVLFGAGTRLVAEQDLVASGTEDAPVVLEAAEGETFGGVRIEGSARLEHTRIRSVDGDALISAAEVPMVLDGLEIEGVTGRGVVLGGEADVPTPIGFRDVEGPLVHTIGLGLGTRIAEDLGGNLAPWIDVDGNAWDRARGSTTWESQGLPIRLGGVLHLRSEIASLDGGVATIRDDALVIRANEISVGSDSQIRVHGTKLTIDGATFSTSLGTWGGIASDGPLDPGTGYDEVPARLELRDGASLVAARSPVIDWTGSEPSTLSVVDTHLAAEGADAACITLSQCSSAVPGAGSTLDCAHPVMAGDPLVDCP